MVDTTLNLVHVIFLEESFSPTSMAFYDNVYNKDKGITKFATASEIAVTFS